MCLQKEKVVRRYGHFEIFFADLWDWRAPVDSLQVLYEQWRQSPVMQEETKGIFQEPNTRSDPERIGKG